MKYKNHFREYILLVLVALILAGCRKPPSFVVNRFQPVSNYTGRAGDTVFLDAGVQPNIFDGIVFPEQGYFRLSFEIRNQGFTSGKFYYKIYYQNESYKNPEIIGSGDSARYNPLASENFYGSWEAPGDSLHITGIIPDDGQFHTVVDSFRIVGNPRNESLYFGKDPEGSRPSYDKIRKVMESIRNSPDWYRAVAEKAEKTMRPVEEQVYLDALWVVRQEGNTGDYNCRWKRNPRAGIYSFVLVVFPAEHSSGIPGTWVNISRKDGDSLFINPYYSMFYKPERNSEGIAVMRSDVAVRCRIRFDLSRGIYIDPLKFTSIHSDSTQYNAGCNSSAELYYQAEVEQFFHHVDKNWVMANVPEIRDYRDFTLEDYRLLEKKYPPERLNRDYISITGSPCETVVYDVNEKAIILTNPPSTPSRMKKENVGIQSRTGFTYGKITARIGFPEMLNEAGIWNGITNAFWLIYQGDGDWNLRRPCDSLGYIPKSEVGQTDVRVRQSFYTEIDIEIVKASKHWPPTSYYNEIPYPWEDPDQPRDIIVTSTNWDLACREPEKFNVGVFGVEHNGKTWLPHRWDHWYKALTMKYAVNHDSIFSRDFYFYQIDWRPDCIIWRIGKDKDHLMEIGYLDTSVTSVPNNQMTFIVTQEYHHADWWPTAPFKQGFIPYPSRPIVGRVYEVEIE